MNRGVKVALFKAEAEVSEVELQLEMGTLMAWRAITDSACHSGEVSACQRQYHRQILTY